MFNKRLSTHLIIIFLVTIIITLIDPFIYREGYYNFFEALSINLGGLVLTIVFPVYFFIAVIEPESIIFLNISLVGIRLFISWLIYKKLVRKPRLSLTLEIIVTVLSLILGRFFLILFIIG